MKRILVRASLWLGISYAGLAVLLASSGPDFALDLELLRRFAGLVGLVLLGNQLLLSSRLPLIERGVGQNVLVGLHRISGVAALVVLLFHASLEPIIQLVQTGGISILVSRDWPKLLGAVSFLVLLVSGLSALFRLTWRLPYDTWRKIHRVGYLVYPLVLTHVLILSTTVRSHILGTVLWWLACGAYLVAVGYRAYAFVRSRRDPRRVLRVEAISHDTISISFSGSLAGHIPGQFVFVQIKSKGKLSPPHPFSLSSAPGGDLSRITVKSVGDFTTQVIPTIEPGDTLYLEGPYGWFTHVRFSPSTPLVFFAGGIGITPFMSMLNFLRDRDPQRRVTLFWGNKADRDIGFQAELSDCIETMPNLRVVHAFSMVPPERVPAILEHERIHFEEGFLDADLVRKYVPEPPRIGAMICGPERMLRLVETSLRELGVPDRRILVEWFNL